MGAIVRQNRTIQQRLGNDALYGSGFDGNVTISGVVYLARDMHYRNLTLSNYAILVTNGFRVYVSGTLSLGTYSTIGTPAAYTSGSGTLVGRVEDGAGLKTYVVGDSATGTPVPAAMLKDIEFVSNGWTIDPTNGFRKMEGADDGVAGTQGANVSAPTLGQPGGPTAGGAGGLGQYAPSNEPGDATLEPGGKGNPGNPGNAGQQGIGGAGGAKGTGGGLVVVLAKSIVSSPGASIVSLGRGGGSGAAGTTGASGNPGTSGQAAPTRVATFAGNPNPAGVNPSTPVPGTHNPAGFTPGNEVAAHYSAGNVFHTPGNVAHKEDHNPAAHHTNSHTFYHHYHNDGYKQYYHNIKQDQTLTGYTHVPAKKTGNHHQYHNPATQGHNPDSHNPAYHNPGHTNPSTLNPTTHAAGNPYPAGHNNEHNPNYTGGVAGAAGTGGIGGTGATGNSGTAGKKGALFIITDSASISATTDAHQTVIIYNT